MHDEPSYNIYFVDGLMYRHSKTMLWFFSSLSLRQHIVFEIDESVLHLRNDIILDQPSIDRCSGFLSNILLQQML